MTLQPEPRWQRLEPDERRQAILACAIRLFGERPFASVSTSDLAREAGVTRGLIHHYFGTKRDLYLEVVREMLYVPPLESVHLPTGPLRERIDACVEWLLRAVEAHGRTWVAVAGAEGVGDDAEVQRMLDEADDLAAARVLDAVGFTGGKKQKATAVAAVRAYGGMAKAASREWVVRKSLTRAQVHSLLSDSLVTIIETSLPRM